MNVKKLAESEKKYKKNPTDNQFMKTYNTFEKVDDILRNQKRRIVTYDWSDDEI